MVSFLHRCVGSSLIALVVMTTLWNGKLIYERKQNIVHHTCERNKRTEKSDILLLTYMRSGSTFTADLLQQAPDVFYVYEPFKSVTLNGYFHQKTFCDSKTGLCRNPKTQLESPDYILEILDRFYDCRLEQVPESFIRPSPRKSKTFANFKDCKRNDNNVSRCLELLKDRCRRSSKLIKTIRLSMDLAQLLLSRIRSLRIIYLMRDPRARFVSEFYTGVLQLHTTSLALSLKKIETECENIKEDLRIYQLLKVSRFKDRIKIYTYEEIANEPFKIAKDMCKFLGLNYTIDVQKWLQVHVAGTEDNGLFETVRKNSSATAMRWRKTANSRLSFLYDKISRACEAVIDTIGYTKFRNLAEIKNLSIPAMRKNPHLDML